MMMMIDAIIKPFKLEVVREALFRMGVLGLIITEIRGFARQRGHDALYRGSEYRTDLVPKIRIQIAAAEPMVQQIVGGILKSAHTGELGDGKIFIHKIESMTPIGPGEEGDGGL